MKAKSKFALLSLVAVMGIVLLMAFVPINSIEKSNPKVKTVNAPLRPWCIGIRIHIKKNVSPNLFETSICIGIGGGDKVQPHSGEHIPATMQFPVDFTDNTVTIDKTIIPGTRPENELKTDLIVPEGTLHRDMATGKFHLTLIVE